jgi:predicted DNA-binding protein
LKKTLQKAISTHIDDEENFRIGNENEEHLPHGVSNVLSKAIPARTSQSTSCKMILH